MRITKDPAERKQELLDASLEIILEKGYEKTSVKEIVSKVGVAQGLFYYYFNSKEDMVRQLCDIYINKYFKKLSKGGFDDCKNPGEAMKILIECSFVFLEENSGLIYKMHEKGNQILHDIVTFTFINAVSKVVKEIIVLGNNIGLFDCEYPEQSAFALMFGIFSVLHDDESNLMIKNINEQEKDFIFSYVSRVLQTNKKTLSQIF